MPKQKVDEVFGVPIYFDPGREKFAATLKGVDYEADRLSDIKRDLKAERPVELEEPVIYADGNGEMILTTIEAITAHGYLTPRERLGCGVPPNPQPRHLFPRSDKNIEIYRRHRSMRGKGWQLIHEADDLIRELELHPPGYWKKKAKQGREKQAEEVKSG